MGALRRPVLWLALAVAAMMAGYAEIDLRLIAAALCGVAVLSGAGAFDGRRREHEP
jgi:hypothetical protein